MLKALFCFIVVLWCVVGTSLPVVAAPARESFAAGFSDPRMRVIDLTPADGQPAAYTIGSTTTQMGSDIYPVEGGAPTQWVRRTVTDSSSYVLQWNWYGNETTLFTEAGAGTMGVEYSLADDATSAGGFHLELGQQTALMLAPHSLLIIDGLIHRSAHLYSPGDHFVLMEASLTGISSSSVRLCCRLEEGTFDEPYQLAYANTGDEVLPLTFALSTWTSTTRLIPEPSICAMLLAGLAALAASTHRLRLARWRARALTAGAAVALYGAAGSASAQSAADPYLVARLSNVQLMAVDLRPEDGIDAGYTMANERVHMLNGVWDFVRPGAGRYEESDPAPGTAASSALNYLAFESSISTDGRLGDASSRIVWDAERPLGSSFYYSPANEYDYSATMTLTPGTALILSGTLLQEYVPRGMHQYELVQSFFAAEMVGPYNTALYMPFKIHYGPGTPSEWNETVDFGLTVTNPGNTNVSIDLTLELYSGLQALEPPSPVPEPPTQAMLSVGLLLLAAATRRRRGGPS